MNKVLVVDDEKLVRQGIITTFPWRRHGFEVVGDAGSGEKALEFLETEDIDLLVTDLAMNGMNGLELIRQVRQTRQDLPVVILTCHDNFKYIQEAMRLGVLDYIVKTEIEDEVVDETLMRIADKLNHAAKKRRLGAGGAAVQQSPIRDALLLCGPSRAAAPLELLGREDPERWDGRLAEVDAATWLLWTSAGETGRVLERIAPTLGSGNWRCMTITGIGADEDNAAVTAKLKRYRRQVLFYDAPDPVGQIAWADIPDAEPADGGAAARISAEWNGPAWIYEDDRFETLLRRTAESAIGAVELRTLFYPVVLEWERLLETGALQQMFDAADDLLFWRNWEAWLRGFRRAVRRTVEKNASRQIADAILKAIERLRTEPDPEAGEAEIARSVNMSRGHFSKSFKRVTGKSYAEYARLLKLERAKQWILRTDEPITRVAELSGFSDYRHFSRVFRDHTGMLPNEYRKTGKRE